MPYKDPEQRRQHDYNYYQLHKERIGKATKIWAENNREKCKQYGVKYRETHREEINRRNRLRIMADPNPHKVAVRKHQQKLRANTLIAYGGDPPRCACCSESYLEFLSIDHIGGGGNIERRRLGISGINFYRWLKKHNYPLGYRVLCFNCNLAIGFYGYCPHQKGGDDG